MNILAAVLLAQALIVPEPGVIFRPAMTRDNEKPVVVETKAEIAADNGLFRRVETTITFTNPNSRVFEGELEFPVPDGATVCGYQLEVNGSMVPGVVVAKEEARVAFENEKKKGVDPGIVEHVKGKTWKTRIYPLMPNTPRKAMVAYIAPNEGTEATKGTKGTVVEKFGDEIFVGEYLGEEAAKIVSKADRLRKAEKATIYWDASMSRKENFKSDRNLLECLPEKGEFTLIVFRNVIEDPLKFTSRADLLKAVDSLVYDGGTCLEKVLSISSGAESLRDEPSSGATGRDGVAPPLDSIFIFSDEYTEPKPRTIRVTRLSGAESLRDESSKVPAPVEGTLLATAWAANRVEDIGADAESHKDELIEIGRTYGVASSVTSLIVLESLQQYKTYKIEPPKGLSFYDEWKKWRAAEDDLIDGEKRRADHRSQLLRYWEERVKWWNDPMPPKRTPKSGLFDGVRSESRGMARASAPMASAAVANGMAADDFEGGEMLMEEAAADSDDLVRSRNDLAKSRSAPSRNAGSNRAEARSVRSANAMARASVMRQSSGDSVSASAPAANVASVTIAAWDPKTPYLKALGDAAHGYAYDEYLKQRELFGNSPAFYLDCAGWFFKAKDMKLGARIISNLSEMKLEEVGLWRTMGWRLREAGLYVEAVEAFRHVLKMRPEEPQSKRDLALVLTEKAKEDFRNGSRLTARGSLEEAAKLLRDAAFEPTARRSGRRGNDLQTSVFALEELNGVFAWVKANDFTCDLPEIEAAFRRDLPCELRIMLSWDTDETDVDLHVLEPDGEEAYYGHRRTSSGGFVSEDVTTGYGPEEYLRKTADKGTYRILANYFASHRQQLTGAATISATVYTGWGTDKETRQIMSLRLDKPRDKHAIGEIEIK